MTPIEGGAHFLVDENRRSWTPHRPHPRPSEGARRADIHARRAAPHESLRSVHPFAAARHYRAPRIKCRRAGWSAKALMPEETFHRQRSRRVCSTALGIVGASAFGRAREGGLKTCKEYVRPRENRPRAATFVPSSEARFALSRQRRSSCHVRCRPFRAAPRSVASRTVRSFSALSSVLSIGASSHAIAGGS
jgi:hypothetical protein